jgi:hypothetical protein
METIPRRSDWRGRLFTYVEKVRRSPYKEGTLDCGLFAAGWVEAITGRDVAQSFRGRYKSTLMGLRRIRREGYIDHVDYARSLFSIISISQATLGDLAVVEGEGGIDSLAGVQGPQIFVLSREGLKSIELTKAKQILQVGDRW